MPLLPFSKPAPPSLRPAPAPGRRPRLVGVATLAIGVVTAGLLYAIETRAAPSADELMPGYSSANSRQMGVFYGHAGVTMWAWREALGEPGTQAIIVLAVSGLVALVCFRVAWLDADRARES